MPFQIANLLPFRGENRAQIAQSDIENNLPELTPRLSVLDRFRGAVEVRGPQHQQEMADANRTSRRWFSDLEGYTYPIMISVALYGMWVFVTADECSTPKDSADSMQSDLSGSAMNNTISSADSDDQSGDYDIDNGCWNKSAQMVLPALAVTPSLVFFLALQIPKIATKTSHFVDIIRTGLNMTPEQLEAYRATQVQAPERAYPAADLHSRILQYMQENAVGTGSDTDSYQ